MSRPQFFITTSAVIFAVEWALPALTTLPVFIFPFFVIMFMLTSRDDGNDLPRIAVASIIFDFFSGLVFGFMTLGILGVCLTIFLAKKIVSIDKNSAISTFVFSLIFTTEYVLLISLGGSAKALFSNWPFFLIETAAISIAAILLFKYALARQI